MAKIDTHAPAKTILFGEHYVVYGAQGLSCGIIPNNRITLGVEDGGGFEYETQIGKMSISPDGKVSCPDVLLPAAAAYFKSVEKWPLARRMEIRARQEKVWPIKGVGNSASLAAAMAAGIAKCVGKEASARECFEVAQESDKVAHGGSPSGIDAAAVSYGGPVLARKVFGEKISYEFSKGMLGGADGWEFLLVDTSTGGKKANTAEQIAKFAKAHGISKKPEELKESERRELCVEYDSLAKEAIGALSSGKMEAVADCMNRNHALLLAGDASSAGIEKAVAAALGAGAAGAKLTGAGGEGGAVLVLCEVEKIWKAKSAISKAGFASHEFTISKDGARAEKA